MWPVPAALAIVLLAATLIAAIARPRGISEALVAVPAALIVLATGAVPWDVAGDTLARFGPTVGYLAAILLLGYACSRAGVFDSLAALMARMSRGGRGRWVDGRRLLALVCGAAAAVTALLTLDATVVLLTPAVLATTKRLGVPALPHTWACLRLANSASLLLPIANLTNLLAFTVVDLSFGRFAALMALPWVAVCLAEWAGLRLRCRADLASPTEYDVSLGSGAVRPPQAAPLALRFRRERGGGVGPEQAPATAATLLIAAATVVALVAFSATRLWPGWPALVGAGAMLIPLVHRRALPLRELAAAPKIGFCLFVLALTILVDGVMTDGVSQALTSVIPDGDGVAAVVAMALIAAALANLINNLPATLVLLPLVAAQPLLTLSMLIGVNIGPNLAYPGSLATLLWRRIVPKQARPSAGPFHRYGAITVPPLLIGASALLWLAAQVL